MVQLRQLKYVLEVHRQGNHISAAAEALNTSQPGISKQIQLLEFELGFSIFRRKRNRIIGLTEPGGEVMAVAQRVLNDVENLRSIREDFLREETGSLTVATTHTYARYVLPPVVDRFLRCYPKVEFRLLQGNPLQICESVDAGQADIAVGTETARTFPNLVMFPSVAISRSLIARKGHPILDVEQLTLEEIAKYPIIAHDRYRSGQWKMMQAFHENGIEPKVLFDAVDADVGKTYVELGLGIAVLATVAVDEKHNPDLCARDVSHLFDASLTYVTVRANSYLRAFVFDFIETFDVGLKADKVRAVVQGEARRPVRALPLPVREAELQG